MTAEAATAESRQAESVAAERRRDVGRAGRCMRCAHAVAVRPCVAVARGDRRDGAASAVVPEPERALRHRDARAVIAEASTAESWRAESVASERRREAGRAVRGVCHARAVALAPCVAVALER